MRIEANWRRKKEQLFILDSIEDMMRNSTQGMNDQEYSWDQKLTRHRLGPIHWALPPSYHYYHPNEPAPRTIDSLIRHVLVCSVRIIFCMIFYLLLFLRDVAVVLMQQYFDGNRLRRQMLHFSCYCYCYCYCYCCVDWSMELRRLFGCSNCYYCLPWWYSIRWDNGVDWVLFRFRMDSESRSESIRNQDSSGYLIATPNIYRS